MEVPEEHIKEGAELLVGTMKRVGHSLIANKFETTVQVLVDLNNIRGSE